MPSSSFPKPTPVACALAAWLAASALPAQAQQGSANGGTALPQVTVTGTVAPETSTSPVYGVVAKRTGTGLKTDTDILEAPQSISVITREQIELQGATGLDEAVRYTSGTIGGAFGSDPRSDWILVRGFRPAIYLDGLAQPQGTWADQTRLEPYLLERLEVLKGPSSVMYGALPPSGFINAVTKRPTPDAIREVGLEVGSFKKRQFMFDFGGALTPDASVQYRLVGLARNSDSNVDYVEDDRYAIAPSVLFKLGSSTQLTLLGQFQKARTKPAGFLPASGTAESNPNGKIPASRYPGEPDYDHYKKDTISVGYELAHSFGSGLEFRQNLRYADFDIDHRLVGANGYVPGSDRVINRYVWTPRERAKTLGFDNQLQAVVKTGAVEHTLLGGIDWRRTRTVSKSAFGFNTGPTLDIYDPEYGADVVTPADQINDRQRQTQIGLYLQDQMRVDRFTVTASVRHDRVETTTDHRIGDEPRDKQKDNETTARLGVNYVMPSGIAPYASWSTSFQPTIGTNVLTGEAFKPTKGRQLEAGVKYRPADGRSLYTAAIYQLEQRNTLTSASDEVNGFYSVQQGKIRSRGVELEARFEPVRNVDFIAQYTYTDAKIKETSVDADRGSRVPLQPKHQASAWFDYRFPSDALSGLSAGAGVRYVGSSYGDTANSLKGDSYTLLDAHAVYDIGNWRLLATVTNLTDKEYISTCQSAAWCFYGYPRTVSVSARYAW